MTTKEDIKNQLHYARKEGQQAGIAAGIEQEKLASARKMKSLGLETSVICEVTGLSPEQVAAL